MFTKLMSFVCAGGVMMKILSHVYSRYGIALCT